MLARLEALWEQILTGLWLVPTLMALTAVGLAWLTANASLGSLDPASSWWLSSGDPQAVSQFLSSLLMSMITLATLAVSITMIVLTLAAGQMGPRLIRNFMADKRSQVMLGYFLATVIYLIQMMRAVQDAGDEGQVHHLAATSSMIFSIGCVFLLLLFVHHLSRSIIADTVIQRVGQRLDQTLEEMLPSERDEQTQQQEAECAGEEGAVLCLSGGGYVQAVEYERLTRCAADARVVIRLDFRPGQFLLPHGNHGRISPASGCTAGLLEEIHGCIALGGQRTAQQDLEFAIRQLVELALRALSPGVNDPFTAITVIDRLSLFIAEAMRREPARSVWHDQEGSPRVIGNTTTFRGLVDAAFNQIRQAGQRPSILIHMMTAFSQLAVQAEKTAHREVLRDHVDLVLNAGRRSIEDAYDFRPLEAKAQEALRLLADA